MEELKKILSGNEKWTKYKTDYLQKREELERKQLGGEDQGPD